MSAERPLTRTDRRRLRRAVQAISTGANHRDVAQLLHVRTSTVERMARLLTSNTTRTGEKNDMSSSVPNPFSTDTDMSAVEHLNLSATLNGKTVELRPRHDGGMDIVEPGHPVGLSITPKPDSGRAVDLADLQAQLDELTEKSPEPASAEADRAAGEDFYRAWRDARAEQGLVDLTEDDTAPTLSVGQAVEWGEGNGKGHGILVEEIDMAEGNAIVLT